VPSPFVNTDREFFQRKLAIFEIPHITSPTQEEALSPLEFEI
jgi:hypothetical protein